MIHKIVFKRKKMDEINMQLETFFKKMLNGLYLGDNYGSN
jgi:hypothetical protein